MPLINGEFKPLELPKKHARVLFDNSRKWRYRCLYGGRNGAKDWSVAAACIERAVRVPTRFLFTREVQLTLEDSSIKLLGDTIKRLGYSDYFDVQKAKIFCKINGSEFIFRGLNDNVSSHVKSTESIDVCVIGEAQDLTKKSMTDLDPTIRKAGSEIWIIYNPQFEDDYVYEFTVTKPPENMIVEHVNFIDLPNAWVSQEILDQAERMKLIDPVLYRNVWLGEPLGKGGRVFPQFNSDIHVIDFEYKYLVDCDLYMAIDPHRKYYPAITWYAVTPTNAVIVYNEWPKFEDLGMWYDEARDQKTFDLSPKELANTILANDNTFHCGNSVTRLGDPRFLAENVDFIPSLQQYGVHGWTGAPFERIATQRENLKQAMYYNPAIPCIGTNTPTWYVDKRCRNKIRAYTRHCYDEKKDQESEVHKDFIDGDRYFLSIHDGGKPRFRDRDVKRCAPIISGAQAAMEILPATGYFGKK